jgi:hypothetical protein
MGHLQHCPILQSIKLLLEQNNRESHLLYASQNLALIEAAEVQEACKQPHQTRSQHSFPASTQF